MFEKPLVLHATKHADLLMSPTTDWRFAAQEIIVPLVYSEVADAAREYPLIFVQDKPLVYALTGIEQGVNAYVDATGRWLATYIPARLRSYPFGLTPMPGKPGEFAIVMDSEAPQLLTKDGFKLFEAGVPSAQLNEKTAILKAMQEAEPLTLALVKVIRDAGLLTDRSFQIRRPNGESSQLGGVQVIDENKLNTMSHEEFAKLRDSGALPLVYAHLLSMASLRQGPLSGKYPQLAAAKPKEVAPVSLEDFRLSFN